MKNNFYLSFYFDGHHRTFKVEADGPDKATKKVFPKAKLWARTIKLNNPWRGKWKLGPKLVRVFLEDGTVLLEADGIGSRYDGT